MKYIKSRNITVKSVLMKKIAFFLILFAVCLTFHAQVPQGFNYQAIARDGSGAVLANAPLQVMFYIQSLSTGGTLFWKELHASVTTNSFGLFSLVIGTGVRQTESTVTTFDLIDWSVSPKYLKTEIYYSGGWKELGTEQMFSVPYALQAKNTDQWLTNGTNIYRSSGNVGIGTNNPGAMLHVTNYGRFISSLFGDKIELNAYNSGNRYTYIDLLADDTYTDYALRIARDNGGPNSASNIIHRGTGPLRLNASDAGSLQFFTSNAEKMRITNSGNVGIGVIAPTSKVAIQPEASWPDDVPLFEVKNKTGIPILAVYNNGVRILVDHTNTKAVKGGFAVGGYDMTKAGKTVDFMTISPDSIRFNINNDNVKALKGGFAVGGYDMTKGTINQDFMYLTPQGSSSGNFNTFIGYKAGSSSTTGTNNVSIGYMAGNKTTTGYNNVFFGLNSGYNNNGYCNTFIGTNAGYSAIGSNAFSNIFIGVAAGRNNYGGKDASNYPFGSSNICIGDSSGYNLQGSTLLQASMNIMIGYCTGKNLITGSNNVIIGQHIGGKIVSGNSNLLIGFGADGLTDETGIMRIKMINNSNPPLLYGSFMDRWLRVGGELTPYSDNGNTLGSASRRWTAVYAVNGTIQTSDRRFKSEINPLTYGLESILLMNPVSFKWKDNSDFNTHFGLIAQDVKEVISEVVDTGDDPNHTLGIKYSEMIPVLINAIKEQQEQIESYKNENDDLKSQLSLLRNEVEQIKAMIAGDEAE
jgi:hypothetical protein